MEIKVGGMKGGGLGWAGLAANPQTVSTNAFSTIFIHLFPHVFECSKNKSTTSQI